jgi:thiamine-phosphate pyrophosphorylase
MLHRHSKLQNHSRPILCYVTDRRALPDESEARLLENIAAAARAGVDWVQLREKDLPGRALARLGGAAIEAAGPVTRLIINDRLDVALAIGAAGVHLGGESLPVAEVARWRRDAPASGHFLIGRSCHSQSEAIAAARDAADYIFFGPIFCTPSKQSYGPPQGLDRLAEVCGAVAVPVLAIGGVTLKNTADCLRAGAAGIAAIRLFQGAENAREVVSALRALKA